MNNSFDIHRFGKLLRHDVKRFAPSYSGFGAEMAGMLLFVPFMMLSQFFTGEDEGPGYRIIMAVSMSLFVASQIPLQLYAGVARKQKRGDIYFAMLPASKCEKYLSIALLSLVLAPLAMIVGNVAFDSLLTAVHMPFYHRYMWQSGIWQELNLPLLCNYVAAFVGPTLGIIYANAIRNQSYRRLMCLLVWLWMFVGEFFGYILFNELESEAILWVMFAVQVLMAVLMGFLGWNKMKKMSY